MLHQHTTSIVPTIVSHTIVIRDTQLLYVTSVKSQVITKLKYQQFMCRHKFFVYFIIELTHDIIDTLE